MKLKSTFTFIFFFGFLFNCSKPNSTTNLDILAFLMKNSSNEDKQKIKKQKKDDEKPKKKPVNQIGQTAPTNLRTVQTSDTISLFWNKVKDKEGKEFVSYEVSIDSGSSWKETKESFYTFKKLSKNQKYSLSVRPKGNESLTAKVSITLGDSPPTKLQGLKIDYVGENLIALFWKRSTDEDNNMISYEVSKDGINWKNIGNKISWIFQDLVPKTTYLFQVRSTTSKSDGDAASISATTDKMNIRFDIDFEEIGLSWAKIVGANSYEVWISNNPVWKDTSKKTSWQFKNLPINQVLTIKVRAKNSKGEIVVEEIRTKTTNVWQQLPLSWKNLLANNVDSIPNNIEERKGSLPTSLTIKQTNDIRNLQEITYNCNSSFKRCYSNYSGSERFQVTDLSPIKYFKHLTKVNIEANNITSIPNELKLLKNLKELKLEDNKLTKIPPLINLEILNLRGNKNITNISEVSKLINLKELNLRYTDMTSIPNGILDLVQLEKLNLANNKITNIPNEIRNLVQLKELNLAVNNITSIPNGILDLVQLEKLDLTDTNITNIPNEINQLVNLKRLDLWYNRITNIQPITGLNNLEILNLKNNKITIIPSEIGNLAKLKDLYLNSNQITEIDPRINQLVNLEKLRLENNNITSSVLTQVFSLSNLVELNLGNNRITTIPADIGSLTNLEKLYLYNNNITNSIAPEIGNIPSY